MVSQVESPVVERDSEPSPRALGALSGAIGAAVALGVGELIAAFIGPASSPLIAVGQGVIRVVPEAIKQGAIELFGQYDKVALVVGTIVILVACAVGIGALARRSVQWGNAGIGVLALIGAVAAGTDPAGGMLAAAPSVIGGLFGALALRRLILASGARPRGDQVTYRDGFDRRTFLRYSGLAAGVAAASGGLGLALKSRFDVSAARAALVIPPPTSSALAAPAGADLAAKIKGLTPLLTSNADFYRIDTALRVPQVDPAQWQLRIHGQLASPVTLSLDDLLQRDLIERDLTLACVSNEVGGNLNGTARFIGVPLGPLLRELGVDTTAQQIFTTSVDGFTASVQLAAVMDGRDAMLAVAMNGEPLPIEHGFPVRMVVPGLFGYVSATKWISDMQITSYADRPAYWTERGWAAKGPVKTFSRIDVPKSGADLSAGTVVVAGIAYAMHRGIDAVEVKVDDGPWQPAMLSPEDNPDMWRQWYLSWEATSGDHVLTVRATDGDGVVQTEELAGVVPDGATGLHQHDVSVD